MDRGNTKREILEASLDLFSVQGYEATSISQIANAVGIRKASLYSHFENKQAILEALVEDVLEHKPAERTVANRESLWMIAPYGVIRKYLRDPALLAQANALKKQGKCAHQLYCKEDRNLKRWLWYLRSQLNYYRKTARYYGNKGLRD